MAKYYQLIPTLVTDFYLFLKEKLSMISLWYIMVSDACMSRVVCPWDLITSFVIDAFKGYGVPEEDAKICADVLLESPATMPPRRQGRAASALQAPTPAHR